MRCFFCKDGIEEGENLGDDELPKCETCEGMMKDGFLLIEIENGQNIKDSVKDGVPNPVRTGRIVVVDDSLVTGKMGLPEFMMQKTRFMFIEKRALEELLPERMLEKSFYSNKESAVNNDFNSKIADVCREFQAHIAKQFERADAEAAIDRKF